MKKFILAIAAVSFLFASCGETATTDEKKVDAAPKTEAPKEEAPKPEAAPATATPKMSNPDAQKFVDEYTQFVKASIDAAKSGDASKVAEITKSSQDWAKKVGEFATKLTPEDQKVWAEYMQKLAADQQAAMTK